MNQLNILWISNVLFPEACEKLDLPIPVLGGWMASGAEALLQSGKVRLSVAALYAGDSLRSIEGTSIRYYLIPLGNGDLQTYFKHIYEELQPQITHIHGTEYSHSFACVKACAGATIVASIQGLVSVYANYYMGGISLREAKPSFRDFVRWDWLAMQQKRMELRGHLERILISQLTHIIGRTSWDRSHVWAINPKAQYHFCNETLRASFYERQWSFSSCEYYSIFLSQAHYPIKGIQQLIKALPLVKRHFPSIKVYVAGNDFIHVSPLRKNGFAIAMEKLMKQCSVAEDIIFLGTLNEVQMAEQYEKAHVFVCPSAIENSPNSIGEAQLVGVPCIASYVGGNMDMVKEAETGYLYRFEETALLAYRICQLFEHPDLCMFLSENGRVAARERHNSQRNAQQLLAIYQSILQHD